ncbi:MAG TPA: hypothetical protein VJI70_00320 [Candidatus Paceibacterota bacterium]
MSNKIWYVEASGHTNEVVANELSTENANKDVLCIDGKKRDLWQCDYALITKLAKNQSSGQLVFTVYYRVGRHGPVRRWPFLNKQKLTLASALKKGVVTKISALA